MFERVDERREPDREQHADVDDQQRTRRQIHGPHNQDAERGERDRAGDGRRLHRTKSAVKDAMRR